MCLPHRLHLLCKHDGVLDGSSADASAAELLNLLHGGEGSSASSSSSPRLALAPSAADAKAAAAQLEWLLLNGRREAACEHAMAKGLWADALLLSSHMDADAWRRVMSTRTNPSMSSSRSWYI